MGIFRELGQYFILMQRVFKKPENYSLYAKQTINEVDAIGIQSLGIIIIISLFMGAVVAMQTAFNSTAPFIPPYIIGFTTRQSVILEFSSTVLSLILAGKVGSRIASEIGSMRITEQIDALEIMGVNSASYLILPKVIAGLLIMPFLVLISMFVAISGGFIASVVISDMLPASEFEVGLRFLFNSFDITYSLIKSECFIFAITSISAYHGYNASGGALSVGRASLKAVVHSSIVILIMNYITTQLLLA